MNLRIVIIFLLTIAACKNNVSHPENQVLNNTIIKQDTISQLNEFAKLGDEMFFNILTHKPDSLVYDFVKKYFPAFTKKFEPGGWTSYAPIPFYLSTIHSFRFTNHPYFDANFKEGRLDLFSNEKKDGLPGITDFQLWFFFDNKKNAEEAFAKLSGMFEKFCKHESLTERNGRKVAEYTDADTMESTNSVQLILTNDELYDGKYKLFFRLGAFTYSENYRVPQIWNPISTFGQKVPN